MTHLQEEVGYMLCIETTIESISSRDNNARKPLSETSLSQLGHGPFKERVVAG